MKQSDLIKERNVSIFIAGSKELKEERAQLKILANDMSSEAYMQGINIKAFSYDHFNDNQDQYNKSLFLLQLIPKLKPALPCYIEHCCVLDILFLVIVYKYRKCMRRFIILVPTDIERNLIMFPV